MGVVEIWYDLSEKSIKEFQLFLMRLTTRSTVRALSTLLPIGLLMASCSANNGGANSTSTTAQSVPSSANTTPSTTSTPQLISSTTSLPSATSNSAPWSPSQIQAIQCIVQYGAPPSSTPASSPSNWLSTNPITMPTAYVGKVSLYEMSTAAGTLALIAPSGWSCTALSAADGGRLMTVSGPNSQREILSVPNGQGPSVAQACPFFPSAAAISKCYTANSSWFANATTTKVSSEIVHLNVPANTTLPLGGSASPYPTNISEIWLPGGALNGSAATSNQGYAVEFDASLTPENSNMADAIESQIDDWYSNPSTAGF